MLKFFKKMFAPTTDNNLIDALQNETFLVDVRTPAEFSAGSVKGAVNIPLDKVSSQLSKFKGKKTIVVFCQSGNRSSQAKRILEQNGCRQVINGGSWQNVKQLLTKLN